MSGTADEYDVIVVGSGVAGLSVALGLAGARRVALITGGQLVSGSTAWAQGGLAGAIDGDDHPGWHADDTATAGAGVCDDSAVRVLTDGAPSSLADLLRFGSQLDRDDSGRLALTREGGHHRRRIVHAGGDATGAEVSRCLVAALRTSDVEILDHTQVIDLCRAMTAGGPQVTGVRIRCTEAGRAEDSVLNARAVVLATGGVGGLYSASTNPPEVSGEGLALGLRAGASLVDLEFVQFHPTALSVGRGNGQRQIPLITEALRGEGAVLRDREGQPIMAGHHPMSDLAPRDVVARRIDEVRSGHNGEPPSPVTLDATGLGADVLSHRFPTVYDACRRHGIDAATQPIPVAPAQHFLCGGIRTDSWGATDIAGLYAVGEVAATGVHGANRLASNSLIEGLVFARRLASRLVLDLPRRLSPATNEVVTPPPPPPAAVTELRSIMSQHVGIRRTGAGLDVARAKLAGLAGVEATQLGLAAQAIVVAAAARRESRGCHWRSDYPASSEWWRRHIVVQLDESGSPVAATTERLERTA